MTKTRKQLKKARKAKTPVVHTGPTNPGKPPEGEPKPMLDGLPVPNEAVKTPDAGLPVPEVVKTPDAGLSGAAPPKAPKASTKKPTTPKAPRVTPSSVMRDGIRLGMSNKDAQLHVLTVFPDWVCPAGPTAFAAWQRNQMRKKGEKV